MIVEFAKGHLDFADNIEKTINLITTRIQNQNGSTNSDEEEFRFLMNDEEEGSM